MSNGIPLEQAKDYLKSLDLSAVVERLVRVEKWKRGEAEEATEQYRNFLFLQKKYGADLTLPPSEEIDEVWHANILHTKAYASFCDEFFGYYFHHQPAQIKNSINSETTMMSLFETTQELYNKEFGKFIYKTRLGYFKAFLTFLFNIKSSGLLG